MFLVKRHYKYHQTLEWSRRFVQRPLHRLFFRPQHICPHFFQLTASEGQT